MEPRTDLCEPEAVRGYYHDYGAENSKPKEVTKITRKYAHEAVAIVNNWRKPFKNTHIVLFVVVHFRGLIACCTVLGDRFCQITVCSEQLHTCCLTLVQQSWLVSPRCVTTDLFRGSLGKLVPVPPFQPTPTPRPGSPALRSAHPQISRKVKYSCEHLTSLSPSHPFRGLTTEIVSPWPEELFAKGHCSAAELCPAPHGHPKGPPHPYCPRPHMSQFARLSKPDPSLFPLPSPKPCLPHSIPRGHTRPGGTRPNHGGPANIKARFA